jgi:hypothetical protein
VMLHWYGERLSHLSFGVEGIFLTIHEDGSVNKVALQELKDRVIPNPLPPYDALEICKKLKARFR